MGMGTLRLQSVQRAKVSLDKSGTKMSLQGRNIEIRLEIYALFYRIKTYESRWRKITLGKEGVRENGELKLEKKRP